MESYTPSVLIVDDNEELADLYETWLSTAYSVDAVYSGEEALEYLDGTVDIVLLDRRMPKMSGEDVLASIRERELDCRVALVTTVEPDFDILDLEFDAYLEKGVTRESLRQLVASLADRMEYDERLQEYLALCSKRATLEEKKEGDELRNHPEFVRLEERLSARENELERLVSKFTEDDFRAVFQRVGKAHSSTS